MPDTPSFVVNDRRKFTSEGELRHDSSTDTSTSEASAGPQLVAPLDPAAPPSELADLPESSAFAAAPASDRTPEQDDETYLSDDDNLPLGPTDEQVADSVRAYDATVDRLDTALRAADPGGERMPAMTFERLTQSLYTQTLLLLGGAAQPGETPRVDILGARQTVDMISVLAEKTKGNLTPNEDKLLQSALFDLRMGFLEITQALARQARQTAPGAPASQLPGTGPRIVR